MNLSRRDFLTAASAAASTAILGSLLDSFSPVSAEEIEKLTSSNNSLKPKWVYVIDLDRCNGCNKCTEACITEMRVPPAWGEPQYQGRQPWIQVFKNGDGTFLPVPCQNCQNAPCAKVCPVGATFYSEDGIVLIDQDRCIGCRICMAACPYQRRFFNWFDPPLSEEERAIKYSPDHNIPHRRGVTEKCIWCRHRITDGRAPACVEACTEAGMSALWFGDAREDLVSNGREKMRLSELLRGRGAFRLKEEFGTEPSVLYLPPRRGGEK